MTLISSTKDFRRPVRTLTQKQQTIESHEAKSSHQVQILPKALRRMTNFDFNQDSPKKLRADLLAHFSALGLSNLSADVGKNGLTRPETLTLDKGDIRLAHHLQRREYLAHEAKMSGKHWPKLVSFFADGVSISPEKIKPVLVRVENNSFANELFRFATTQWSIPVSRGFGRRMRYLVMDEYHEKLIGIFALGDPVFNLRARDAMIGWSHHERSERLVDIMDGYIIGSLPPYSALLGGKLVTSLIGSKEVSEDFKRKYGHTKGIISEEHKQARLTLVTVTSALGKSSIYNRLHLKDPITGDTLVRMDPIGMTDGYGHFHLSENLFSRMRFMLIKQNHSYASQHQFGDGPNWRLRTIRVALIALGLSPNLVRHGISREVFAMPLVQNYKSVLLNGKNVYGGQRPSVDEISAAALTRWILPRAESRPEYRSICRKDYLSEQMKLIPSMILR